MIVPPTPLHEPARLASLHAYGVLDTPPEPAFDALTRLAARVVEAPVSLITLVDAHRQWFKSCYGLALTETPRDVSFCGHVVADERTLVVNDTHLDPRFHDNPFVAGAPFVRFYAGVPLCTPGGEVLGTLCVLDFEPRALTDEQHELLALLAVQAMALLELRRSERTAHGRRVALETHQQYFELSPTLVCTCDRVGRLDGLNPAWEQVLGHRRADLLGRSFVELLHPDDVARTRREAERMLEADGRVVGFENRYRHHDGHWVWLSWTATTGGGTTYAVARDVTAEKLAMERWASAPPERPAPDAPTSARSTHALAAGIGHEINNPLTYVLGNVSLALEQLHGLEPQHARPLEELLLDVRAGAERIRGIVQGLQALGRDGRPPEPVAVRVVVDAALELSRHELRERTSLTVALPDALPLLWVDEPRVAQALANLLINAAQAFRTADPAINHVWLTAQTTPEGRVSLTVRDNGPGIAADARARLLEPFFSTTASRLGLGLPIAHGIVARAGGTLAYETTEGVGTTFRVELPAAPRAELTAPAVSLRARVLVVDDDGAVLRAVARLLSQHHDVVAIQDSEEALERVRGGARFDVVFCDVLMPALSGLDLYTQVVALWPAAAQRFVFMSGGVLDEAIRARLAAMPHPLLEKPVAGRQLSDLVQRLVGAGHSPRTSSGV